MVFLLLILLSFPGISNSAPIQSTSKVGAVSILPKPIFTLKEVEDLTKNKSIRVLEDLLKLLPPPLLENFTFIQNSHSLQEASTLFPRAVLFGPDAQFLLSFNGHSSQKNFNSVEMIQFNIDTKSFSFATVELDPSGKRASFNGDASRCLGCHGNKIEELKPIWSMSYPVWPGAYGSLDDVILDKSKEATNYGKFIELIKKMAPNYSRYLTLKFIFEKTYPGSSEKVITPYPPYTNFSKINDLSFRPNLALQISFERLRAYQIAHKFITSPRWANPKIRNKILMILTACEDPVESELPKETLEDWIDAAVSSWSANALNAGATKEDVEDEIESGPVRTHVHLGLRLRIAAHLLGMQDTSLLMSGVSPSDYSMVTGDVDWMGLHVASRVFDELGIAPLRPPSDPNDSYYSVIKSYSKHFGGHYFGEIVGGAPPRPKATVCKELSNLAI